MGNLLKMDAEEVSKRCRLLIILCVCCCIYVVAHASPEIVYIVTLRDSAVVHQNNVSFARNFDNGSSPLPGKLHRLHKPSNTSNGSRNRYSSYLIRVQDSLLKRTLKRGTYRKLYSYHYLINGFAILITQQQVWTPRNASFFFFFHFLMVKKETKFAVYVALNRGPVWDFWRGSYIVAAMVRTEARNFVSDIGKRLFAWLVKAGKLADRPEVSHVTMDFSVHTSTTHTPDFLGLPKGAWVQDGGPEDAGEGIVIGFIDTGIEPTHPSFSDKASSKEYPIPGHFTGACEVTRDFPSGSCNRKLIGARHFAASAIARGIFNASEDYASPLDGNGHGTHTASIAAGNHGVPVIVDGHHFGNASGMAPRAHIAIYKALYKSFGGFAADVVAAIDQAAQDGVDILSLSITPNRPPPGVATFFNPIDMALLSAVKAGIFVVQAAGNTGPSPRSILSFSPWIFSVGAAVHDRVYNNAIVLGNNLTISGVGLAPGTDNDEMYSLVAATHAQKNGTDDMYANECQDPGVLQQEIIEGKILICSYTIRFVLGLSSVREAVTTAKNLSAVGIIFYADPFVMGFQLNPVPMMIPGLIIPSSNDSKVFLEYYNESLIRDESNKTIKFGAVARILGGLKANYSKRGPKVVYYSSRGPTPEDNFLDEADVLKPNIIAPGNLIWAAWSSVGTDSVDFEGEKFAMISGTSMAAPHIAGAAALLKQKYPDFSPAAIASALSTTASVTDKQGGPIMAQRSFSNPDASETPATPFDMGSGTVDPTAALDPGLIFNSGFDDYVTFLCSINGSAPLVLNYTGIVCGPTNGMSSDLNIPSITIAHLNNSRSIERRVTNIAGNESYSVLWNAPLGVSVSVIPTSFTVGEGKTQNFTIFLNATSNSTVPSFGSIVLIGSHGHKSSIPLSIISMIFQNSCT